MLFSYPIAASTENWIHECLVAAISAVHAKVESNTDIPRKWTTLLPESHREKLKMHRGLKSRLADYHTALKLISAEQRAIVLEAVSTQNNIVDLLRCDRQCKRLEDLPEAIHASIRSLADYAFELLTEFEVRQRQYQGIWEGIPAKMCGFCGCEYFDAPGAPQEDLDHYLPRSKYPFAAANLRNLPPMGGKCNSSYKRAKDPLYRDDGSRRKAFDPYSAPGQKISLLRTEINEQSANLSISNWVIDFIPASEEAETWNSLFHIRERYERDILKVFALTDWLEEFKSHCQCFKTKIHNDAELLEELERYRQYIVDFGFKDRKFLKAAFLDFVLSRCKSGCQRLLDLLRDFAGISQHVSQN